MADTNAAHDEKHGVSVVENTPEVSAGYGSTAKREGAMTKQVYNVRDRSIRMHACDDHLTFSTTSRRS